LGIVIHQGSDVINIGPMPPRTPIVQDDSGIHLPQDISNDLYDQMAILYIKS